MTNHHEPSCITGDIENLFLFFLHVECVFIAKHVKGREFIADRQSFLFKEYVFCLTGWRLTCYATIPFFLLVGL